MTADDADGTPIRFPQEVGRVIAELESARRDWRKAQSRHAENGIRFPSRAALKRILAELCAALFPLRLGPPELTAENENAYVSATLETTLDQLGAQIVLEFDAVGAPGDARQRAQEAERIIGRFAGQLGSIRRALDADVEAAYRADPAARSVDEVLLRYPSILAVIHYRLAHALFVLGSPIVARTITELAHRRTGIDIHPGASIGRSFFIDHGTGVVIGETAVIGDRVHLHQGVTLGGGAIALARAEAGGAVTPRHPRLGDDVLVHAGATLIGPITVGSRSTIEGNVWLGEDVGADTVVRAPRPVLDKSGA